MGKLIAGVDTSTQATKVLVVDADTGTLVAQGRAGHTVTGERGSRETDPREWWAALKAALAETGRAAEVEAIAVGGQQHGLVALGADGEPLRPSMLWNDTRSDSVFPSESNCVMMPTAGSGRTPLTGVLMSRARYWLRPRSI